MAELTAASAAAVLVGSYAGTALAVAGMIYGMSAGATRSRPKRLLVAVLFGAVWPLVVLSVITGGGRLD